MMLNVVGPVCANTVNVELTVGADVVEHLFGFEGIGHVHVCFLTVDNIIVVYILTGCKTLNGVIAAVEFFNVPQEENLGFFLLPSGIVALIRSKPSHCVLVCESRIGCNDVVSAIGYGINGCFHFGFGFL